MEQKNSSNWYRLRVLNNRGLENINFHIEEGWELAKFGPLTEFKFYLLLKRKDAGATGSVGNSTNLSVKNEGE